MKKVDFFYLDLKTTLEDDFSSKSCSPSRDGNTTTQVESIESKSQPETIGRLGKTLFH